MMPIIRPMPSQCSLLTEYKKEQEIFAKMETEFRARKRILSRTIRLLASLRNRGPRRQGAGSGSGPKRRPDRDMGIPNDPAPLQV